MLNLDYRDKRALHEQIEDGIKEMIVSGILAENEQLPSVRELSMSLTVNPNTVQKAYKQLEAEGFIYSVKAKGNFVAPVPDVKNQKKIDKLYTEIAVKVKNLIYLGEDKEALVNLINNIYSETEA